MFLAFITFLTAFAVEGLGTFVSIVGLTSFLGYNPVIMALAAALDAGKLLAVTILYKYWGSLNRLMRWYMVFATIITMAITSAGAFGYLSASFQKTIMPTKSGMVQEQTLSKERERLEVRKNELTARKVEIDKQIANLPTDTVKGRRQLIKDFKTESQEILNETKIVQDRLFQIDKDIAATSIQNIDTQAHAGPIIFLAQTFDIPLEQAVKYVILMIIFVFDPLAVVLVLAGNFLLDNRKKPVKEEKKPETEEKVVVLPAEEIAPEPIAPEPVQRTPLPPIEIVSEPPVQSPEPEVVEPEHVELELMPIEKTETVLKEINFPTTQEKPEKTIVGFTDSINVHAAGEAIENLSPEPNPDPSIGSEEWVPASKRPLFRRLLVRHK